MEVVIRLAGLEEIPVVHEVMMMAFEEYRGKLTPPAGALSETVEDITKKITERGGAILALVNGAIAGSGQFVLHDQHVYIGRVSVLPSYRGQGIGKRLVRFIESYAKDKGLTEARLGVRLSIPDNIAFYSKLNYEAIEKHAYPDETDYWYIMKNTAL